MESSLSGGLLVSVSDSSLDDDESSWTGFGVGTQLDSRLMLYFSRFVSVDRRLFAIVLIVVAVEMELLTVDTFVSSIEIQMFLLKE